MKGVVIMRIRSECTKSHHEKTLMADARREQMQNGRIPEEAIKSFDRKPYQIGGSKNECSGKNANKD